MIRHVVLWKLKEDNKQANLEQMRRLLTGLKDKIDVIRSAEVGLDVVHGEASYDIALVMNFDSLTELDVYLKHPEHLKVGDFIAGIRDKRVAVDYEY